MNDYVGLGIIITICIVCGVVSHLRCKGFWTACALAGLSSTILFQVIVTLHLGHLDPFFIIALISCFIWGAVIAIPTGCVTRRMASKPTEKPSLSPPTKP